MIRELRGWHVAAMFITGFGIIIAVNLTLAFNAVATFPGLEVRNSYVASQEFDRKRAAQMTLGWHAVAQHEAGILTLRFNDAADRPVRVAQLDVIVGRATHVAADVAPDLIFDGRVYTADLALAPGSWLVRVVARAKDGTSFEQRLPLHVKG